MKEVINILDSRTENSAGLPASGGPALPTAPPQWGKWGPSQHPSGLDPESGSGAALRGAPVVSLLLYFPGSESLA